MNIPEDIHRILVVNLGGIGDFLLSLPALRALKKRYPEATIAFLGVPRTCAIVKDFHLFTEVIVFSAYDENTRAFRLNNLNDLLKFLLWMRKQRFDMAINMRTLVSWGSAFKMALLFYAIGARWRVGRNTCGRGFFLNIKVPESDSGDRLERDYDLATVEALGADIRDQSIDINSFLPPADEVDGFFQQVGISQSDLVIGINPGGAKARQWPLSDFKKVMATLACKLKICFLIFSGPQEAGLALELKDLPGVRAIPIPDFLSFREFAALVRRCNLLITNDTGPMHIAAILKTPLVAIFGPGYLTRFDPRGISDKSVVLYKRVDCAPCNKTECASMKCLKEIGPGDVVDAVLELLNREKRA
jgi:ADP-heptose:LPS heptosyltransferase